MIVCGDAEARHGIILAKNYIAKNLGVKTGEANLGGKAKVPWLSVSTSRFSKVFTVFSVSARELCGL
ncbi:hypothetical protein [Pelosinus fermentans]|uniref:hypothetical protein n=1 Tax=Pelosinus fermentans TaxID=365349 RepID=UPI001ED98389|nr:hypothetical protein [Pelosinus fermentans]